MSVRTSATAFVYVFVLGLGGAAVGAACGSSEADSVFGRPSGGTGTESAGSGQGGMSGSSSASSAQGGGTTSSGSSGSSSQSSASSGAASSSSGSSSSSASSSGSSSSSSSGGPAPIQVYCKDAPCAPGEVCCFNLNSADLDMCAPPGSCDAAQDYITIACNDIEDCPGQECCGDFQNGDYLGVACFDQCSAQQIIMCEGHPEVCQGGQCFQSMKLGAGYSYCQ